MINKVYRLMDEQFVNLIKNSSDISEVLFKLGYTVNGNSWAYSQVKRRMEDLNLKYSDFKGKFVTCNHLTKVTPESLFSSNSKHNRTILRKYILSNNIIPYKCAICGLTNWNNKTLSLELDHINGINNDNRLENLRFLCPNCHSQTTTYGSRNQKINETSYDITDDLRKLVETEYKKTKSIKVTSANLNIKRCVVNKIINESNLKRSNQKYVIRYDCNHNEIKRYGSLIEAAKCLIDNNEVKTKKISTCTRTITYNKDNFWLNSYWKILDGCGIKNNPQLESSLIDSENSNIDEAQANSSVND